MPSIPDDSSHTIYNRGRMLWYNPYENEITSNIWPEQSTSSQANNYSTKTLVLQTALEGDYDDSLLNGIMAPIYGSIQDYENIQHVDIWLNTENIMDDSFKVHIDIGYISEDINNNGVLDT